MRISDWSSDVCSSDLLAEPPDDAHHVRGRDAAVEIDRPALDNLHQILGTDDIGARLTRLIGLRTLGEHADAHRLAGALGQRDDAARSEEHTSELPSLMRISYAVICLQHKNYTHTIQTKSHQ